ncbi:MAG: hypothetical protein FJX99_04185 [Bacteroidetes bacterium]|nr:hypothetical protein [Bacteroidota bacterium]
MLLYRFPGKKTQRKSGCFVPCSPPELEGFVISTFSGGKYWRFVESESSDALFLEGRVPSYQTKEEYILKANQLINAIRSLGLKKVVLSRVATNTFDTDKKRELFNLLEEKYPNALVYFFSDRELGTWIGASPEIIFEQHGQCGVTTSLAGTKKLEDSSSWTEKEKLEQDYVSLFIKETLNHEKIKNLEVHGPYEYKAGPVKHLKTDFLFECSQTRGKELLLGLHPTPAVCGLPKDFAAEIIKQIEEHDRELYTGFIGEFCPDSSKIYVNLRCAKITTGALHYFLGGGFTKDSIAETEWEETENKKKTIADLLEML